MPNVALNMVIRYPHSCALTQCIHRLQQCRKPSLLVHIRDEIPGPASSDEAADEGPSAGEVSEALMRVLLEQGRLKLEQVIAAAAQQLDQPVDEARASLQRHFFGLVQVRISFCSYLQCIQ